jgi:hypothetical protein
MRPYEIVIFLNRVEFLPVRLSRLYGEASLNVTKIASQIDGRRSVARGSRFSLSHAEFNEFLFASVGVETNGIPLTVLSAFTRLGLDPWGDEPERWNGGHFGGNITQPIMRGAGAGFPWDWFRRVAQGCA